MSQPALAPFGPDACRMCGTEDAHPDDHNGLCNSCATELAMDRAEMDRDDCRVNRCSPGCAWCGGCGVL